MKAILIVVLLFNITNGFSQTTQTRYFNNRNLQKETTPEKGKFMQAVTRNSDGSVTVQVVDVNKNDTLSVEIFKGEEPVGVWKYKGRNIPNGLDYSFDLVYSDKSCKGSIAGLKNYFENNDSLQYVAPKISTGERTIYDFISKNLIYPPLAKENNIQGRVYLTLTITRDGKVEDIVVKKGVHIVLDKEAVRVIRNLTFSPPTLNGQSQDVCIMLPISFRLE